MKWPWWLRFGRRPTSSHDVVANVRAEEEVKLRKAQYEYWLVEVHAKQISRLPPDEFARRVQEAFEGFGGRRG